MIQDVCFHQHEEILSNLLQFVDSSHSQSQCGLRSGALATGIRQGPFRREIPTAVLVAGQLYVYPKYLPWYVIRN